jgi:hypothetical protein
MEEDGRSRKFGSDVIRRQHRILIVRDPCLFDRNGYPSGDHFALFTSLEISKPPKQHNTESYRKFSEINTTDLIQDLNTSKIVQNCISGEVCLLLNKYLETVHDELSNLIYAYVVRLYDGLF